MNDDNLIPTTKRTKKEARELGIKGGKKSGEVRRQRKTQREQLQLLLSLPLKNPKAVEQIKNLGIEDNEINNQMAMNVAMFNLILKGGKGAVQAYNSINDLIGENAKKELEQTDRCCLMMEYEPKYVDLIIARWEQFTGKKAEKIN